MYVLTPKSLYRLLNFDIIVFSWILLYILGVKEAYLHTYGDEPGAEANVQGYVKKMNDKGDDGYKHFDSYHKKDSDKFGFEVHSEFGKLDKADVDTESGKQEESKESSEKGNLLKFKETNLSSRSAHNKYC